MPASCAGSGAAASPASATKSNRWTRKCWPASFPPGPGMAAPRHGTDALLDALTLLQGAPVPASTLEVDVLPARVGGYRPDLLDELLGSGELVWAGAGAIGPRDG